MNKKVIYVFAGLLILVLCSCSQEKLYEEAKAFLLSGDYENAQACFTQLSKKDKELTQKFIDGVIVLGNEIENEGKESGDYESAVNELSGLILKFPQSKEAILKNMNNLYEEFKNEAEDIYDTAVETGSYEEGIEQLNNIKEKLPEKEDIINEYIGQISAAYLEMADSIYNEAWTNGKYNEGIEKLSELKPKLKSEEKKVEEYIKQLQDVIPYMQAYKEGMAFLEEGKYTQALDAFLTIDISFDHFYSNIEDIFKNTVDSLYKECEAKIKMLFAEKDFSSVPDMVNILKKYDEVKADLFLESINDIFKAAIGDMYENGSYELIISTLNEGGKYFSSISDYINNNIKTAENLLLSKEAYNNGCIYFNKKEYSTAVSYFNKVDINAEYYYKLAADKKTAALTELNKKYIAIAKEAFSKKDIDKAIINIDTALSYKQTDETLALKNEYEEEKARYLSSSEIFDKYQDSIVIISIFDENNEAIGSGSGFIITADGKIITNFHVVKTAYSLVVELKNGQKYIVESVYAYNYEHDYAIIKINADNLTPVVIGDSTDILNGEKIVTISNPKGLNHSLSEGIISSVERKIEGLDNTYIQITAPISSGSSGGALFNMKGEVLGITTACIVDSQNLNLAVPINVTKDDIENTDSISFNEFATTAIYIEETYFENGQYYRYEGMALRGRAYGKGIEYYNEEGTVYYEGDFKDGLYEGYGKFVMEDIYSYTGEFKGDTLHGYGTMYYSNGAVLDGYFYDGSYVGSENGRWDVTAYPTNNSGELEIYLSDAKASEYKKYTIYYSEDLITWNKKENVFFSNDYILTGLKDETYYKVYIESSDGKSNIASAMTKPSKLNVISNDGKEIFLGSLLTYDEDKSITNEKCVYGSTNYIYSIWNKNSVYGSDDSDYSAFNAGAEHPPKIVNGKGETVGYLTCNQIFYYDPGLFVILPDYTLLSYVAWIYTWN